MKHLLIILLSAIISSSCSLLDDGEFDPFLPEATSVGANTFGCYANGILITPRDGEGTFGGRDRGFISYVGGSPIDTIIRYRALSIHDYKSDKRSSLEINMRNVVFSGEGEYTMDDSECVSIGAYLNDNLFCKIYNYEKDIYSVYCSIKETGFITITRYGDGYLSGTFYCSAVNKNDPDDIIEITDGRFDVYSPTLRNAVFP